MSRDKVFFNVKNSSADWLTIHEAVKITKVLSERKITDGDIYRHALHGDIVLSIYFQSSVMLRKIQKLNHKIKLKPIRGPLVNLLCQLERNCFLTGRNLVISTEGEYVIPKQRIIDTILIGHEYVYIQTLLAKSLNIPSPVSGVNNINYGISVNISGVNYLLFNKQTWSERIKYQIAQLPENIASDIHRFISAQEIRWCENKDYFPVHELPQDACFVIRHTELEKLIGLYSGKKTASSTSPRMSTPLSRLLWLACKHNETISPLIRQPYKLLSIFEQWAADDGITDRLSGDTLKNALERGSPSSTSLSD